METRSWLFGSSLLLLAFTFTKRVLLVPVLVLAFTNCAQKSYIVIPVEPVELCTPDRGEDQDVLKRVLGHSFDSTESECI